MIGRIKHEFHDRGPFREQIAVLYPGEFESGRAELIMVRDFVSVGTAGSIGFGEQPGEDTASAWQQMDDFIEKHGVCGFYHTHPHGFEGFSQQDHLLQSALAMANGSKLLWHIVQAVGSPGAHVISCHMINKKVKFYDHGWISSHVDDLIIYIPNALHFAADSLREKFSEHDWVVSVHVSEESICILTSEPISSTMASQIPVIWHGFPVLVRNTKAVAE